MNLDFPHDPARAACKMMLNKLLVDQDPAVRQNALELLADLYAGPGPVPGLAPPIGRPVDNEALLRLAIDPPLTWFIMACDRIGDDNLLDFWPIWIGMVADWSHQMSARAAVPAERLASMTIMTRLLGLQQLQELMLPDLPSATTLLFLQSAAGIEISQTLWEALGKSGEAAVIDGSLRRVTGVLQSMAPALVMDLTGHQANIAGFRRMSGETREEKILARRDALGLSE